MTDLVFLPLSGGQLRSWAASGTLPGSHTGYAVTPTMLEVFGVADPEDAEYTALSVASVAGLLAHGERVVAVLGISAAPGDDEFGAVEVASPSYSRVTALFGEDTDPSQAHAAAISVQGMTLDQAWEAAAVQALLYERDLLWYGPAEWETLARQ
ncbi:MAG: hypothetical protein KIT69_08730 [Propionibacteriaceae bacterium]|nr:hypothetical protein [Propionibacteriaceae bacterium]